MPRLKFLGFLGWVLSHGGTPLALDVFFDGKSQTKRMIGGTAILGNLHVCVYTVYIYIYVGNHLRMLLNIGYIGNRSML